MRSIAPHRTDRQAMLGVDDGGESRRVYVFADVGILRPDELIAGDPLARGGS